MGDDAAREVWGRPDGAGGKAHRFGHVVFPDCEDPYELMGLTRSALRGGGARRASPTRWTWRRWTAARACGWATTWPWSTTPAPRRGTCGPAACGRVRELGEGEPVARLTLGTVERTTWAASAEVAARVSAVEETAATASDTVASYEDLGTRGF